MDPSQANSAPRTLREELMDPECTKAIIEDFGDTLSPKLDFPGGPNKATMVNMVIAHCAQHRIAVAVVDHKPGLPPAGAPPVELDEEATIFVEERRAAADALAKKVADAAAAGTQKPPEQDAAKKSRFAGTVTCAQCKRPVDEVTDVLAEKVYVACHGQRQGVPWDGAATDLTAFA